MTSITHQVRQGAERYEELRGRFNLRVQRHPAVIVLCRDAGDVATAVRYARQEGLAVSVKSGGHSFEGFSSNDGGLVVDLSLLNQIEWLDEESVRVGPGCWPRSKPTTPSPAMSPSV